MESTLQAAIDLDNIDDTGGSSDGDDRKDKKKFFIIMGIIAVSLVVFVSAMVVIVYIRRRKAEIGETLDSEENSKVNIKEMISGEQITKNEPCE